MDTWQQKLAERGILEEAMRANWQLDKLKRGSAAWSYPIYDAAGNTWKAGSDYANQLIRRLKVIEQGEFDNKYEWRPGKPADLHYYLFADTAGAVVAAQGALYIASGEPDSLVYRTAGAKNVLNWYGEKAIPVSLVSDLKSMGVRTVYHYPDCDDVGRDSARKLAERFALSDIDYYAYALPYAVAKAHGSDINRLWIDCRFDADAFWFKLAACEPLVFESRAELPLMRAADATGLRSGLTGNALPDDFVQAIEAKLGVAKYKHNGWSEDVRCPLHADEGRKNAAWHRDMKVLHCFVCHGEGESALAKDVGEALGLKLADYAQPYRPVGQNGRTPLPDGQHVRQAASPPATPGTLLPIGNKPATKPEPESVVSAARLADIAKAQAKSWADDPKTVRGLCSGFKQLDHLLSGFWPSDIVMIMARFGVGKSTLAMQMALCMQTAAEGLLFTTEMHPLWYMHRIVSFWADLNTKDIFTGSAKWSSLEDLYLRAGRLRVNYYMKDSPDPATIRREAEALKKRGGKWLIVDSLQNVSKAGLATYPGTEAICDALRYCARDLNLTVIATCQANRGPADRANKEPVPSDAQGGGVIEQVATRFLVLHRPGYDIATGEVIEKPGDQPVDPTAATLRVRKDRFTNAAGQPVPLRWLGHGYEELDMLHVDLRDYETYQEK